MSHTIKSKLRSFSTFGQNPIGSCGKETSFGDINWRWWAKEALEINLIAAEGKREFRELLRVGSNLAGGVGVSGGEGRVGSAVVVVGFSSSPAIEGSFRFVNDFFF